MHVVSPHGELIAGEGDSQLKQVFEELLEAGHKRVVVDFEHVPYIDSSVLGQLVYGHSRFLENKGGLRLIGVSKRIRKLLQLTRLILVFEVCENREKALEGWR